MPGVYLFKVLSSAVGAHKEAARLREYLAEGAKKDFGDVETRCAFLKDLQDMFVAELNNKALKVYFFFDQSYSCSFSRDEERWLYALQTGA